MVITYHGLEFFKVTLGDLTIALNPISKSSKHKSASFGADLVLTTLKDEDFNGSESVSRGDKEPFVISGPGEYEYKGVFIQGFHGDSEYKGKKRINTFYNIVLEDTTLCFLGALGSHNLKENIGAIKDDVDILFLPIGGDGVLDPAESYKLAVGLSPKIIIPMHYDEKNLKSFLKEGGEDSLKPIDKLTVKKKDLIGKEGEIVILSQI